MPSSKRSRKTPGNLPTFAHGPGPWDGWIVVTCQRCKNSAVVHEANWRAAGDLGTRPCTYCFKTSRIDPQEAS